MSETEYQQRLGANLRAIRSQQDLTLQDVEERSDGVWKAVVVGSYERGDRAISIAKLADLARFYGVPLGDLLPRPEAGDDGFELEEDGRMVLDLTKLEQPEVPDPRLPSLRRYARRIQVQRGDYNGQVLTLRATDVGALAALFDTDTDHLVDALSERNILRTR